MTPCIVMTSAPSEEAAAVLARQIVEARLGACVQIVPIRSFFVWQGAVNDEREHLLLIKTRADLYEHLEALIRECHPYELPEILQVPVTDGSAPYLSWIEKTTGFDAR